MPQVIETMSRRVHWGWVSTNTGRSGHSDWGNIEADWNTIDGKMNELANALTEEGWEIRSVVPLVGSRFYTEGLTNRDGVSTSWGAGYGYGAAYTEGVVVMCQRWVEISQEEHDRRQQRRAESARARAAAQAAKERQDAHDQVMAKSIDRKGLFDANYVFDGQTYGSKAEAEAARARLAKSKLEAV